MMIVNRIIAMKVKMNNTSLFEDVEDDDFNLGIIFNINFASLLLIKAT